MPSTVVRGSARGARIRDRAIVAGLLTVIAALTLPVGPATAADVAKPEASPSTWTVQPSSAEGPSTRAHFVYDVAPSGTITDYVGITNLSTRPLTLRLYAGDAFNTSSGGFDLRPGSTPPTDVGSWVNLTQSEITVPARRRLDVPFTVTVPAEATPGDHTGGIVASLVTSTTAADGNQVSVDNRVGSRIYLRVDGPLRPSAAVTQLDTRYLGTSNPIGSGAVDVAYTVRNTGNTLLSGDLSALVKAPFGYTLQSTDLGTLPELLPGNSFNGTVRLAGVAPAFRLNTELTVAAISRSGGATATATTAAGPVPAGDPLPPVLRAGSSWAMPWNLLTILLALVVLAVLQRRRRRDRAEPAPVPTAAQLELR